MQQSGLSLTVFIGCILCTKSGQEDTLVLKVNAAAQPVLDQMPAFLPGSDVAARRPLSAAILHQWQTGIASNVAANMSTKGMMPSCRPMATGDGLALLQGAVI